MWAVSDAQNWFWVPNSHGQKVAECTYTQMYRSPDRDQWECVVDGRRLVVTGREIAAETSMAGRLRTLPEPEFGTGWDDFDWSK